LHRRLTQALLLADGVPGKAHSRWSARQGSLQMECQARLTPDGVPGKAHSRSHKAHIQSKVHLPAGQPGCMPRCCPSGKSRPRCCRPAVLAKLLCGRLMPAGHAAVALPWGPCCCAAGSCLQAMLLPPYHVGHAAALLAHACRPRLHTALATRRWPRSYP